VLRKRGGNASSPVSAARTANAQTFAWLFAENADLGMSPAMQASPRTWMSGFIRDCRVAGTIGHQPDASVSPACCAIAAAACGGTMLATAARWVASSVVTVIAAGSTATTLPPNSPGTHSIMPS